MGMIERTLARSETDGILGEALFREDELRLEDLGQPHVQGPADEPSGLALIALTVAGEDVRLPDDRRILASAERGRENGRVQTAGKLGNHATGRLRHGAYAAVDHASQAFRCDFNITAGG